MHLFEFVTTAVFVFATVSCAPSDDERCSEHQRYVEGNCVCEEGYGLAKDKIECVPVEDDEGTDSESVSEDLGDLSGLGDACDPDEGQCDDNPAASFCAFNAMTNEGKCTIADCVVDDDDCPGGWTCCDFDEVGDAVFGGRNLCLDKEMLDEIAKYGVGCL